MKTKIDCGCEKDVFVCRKHCKPQHTPTPWKIDSSFTPDMDDGIVISGHNQDGDLFICELVDKADAAFIVEAVNAYEKHLAFIRKVADGKELDENLRDEAKAIAKAEAK